MIGMEAVRLAEIRSSQLSADEVLSAVSGPAYGGTALFLGTVRDHDAGRSVRTLEYSAHPSAPDRLRALLAEIAGESPGVAVAAVHRVGDLQVGDIAVIAAAAAGHRDEAFRIGRTLIDRIKAEVPLWKRQEFSDGEIEWVGACD